MTVYGDGKQTRSFQFVSDLVSSSHPFLFSVLLHVHGFLIVIILWIIFNIFDDLLSLVP